MDHPGGYSMKLYNFQIYTYLVIFNIIREHIDWSWRILAGVISFCELTHEKFGGVIPLGSGHLVHWGLLLGRKG